VDRYTFSKLIALAAGILCVVIAIQHNKSTSYFISGNIYGTTWSITSDKYINKSNIQELLNRIDFIASNYKENSLINTLNKKRDYLHELTNQPELCSILGMAKMVESVIDSYRIGLGHISASNGFAPVFNEMPALNNDASTGDWLFELITNDDCRINIGINSWLDLSSLAKGFAIDVINAYLKDHDNYLIDIGGELSVKGSNKNNLWNVGLQDPKSINNKPIYIISINSWYSIATSGEYRNYKIKNNKKISHTINPNTLNSINNNLLSVTVVTDGKVGMYKGDYPVTIFVDALATAFNAMGFKNAYDHASKADIAALFILEEDGDISIVKTQKWYDLKL
tara:strand:- start:12 stop:1028 length:1017 start_codon:yes stop_codon:yes gene_type:complete